MPLNHTEQKMDEAGICVLTGLFPALPCVYMEGIDLEPLRSHLHKSRCLLQHSLDYTLVSSSEKKMETII